MILAQELNKIGMLENGISLGDSMVSLGRTGLSQKYLSAKLWIKLEPVGACEKIEFETERVPPDPPNPPFPPVSAMVGSSSGAMYRASGRRSPAGAAGDVAASRQGRRRHAERDGWGEGVCMECSTTAALRLLLVGNNSASAVPAPRGTNVGGGED